MSESRTAYAIATTIAFTPRSMESVTPAERNLLQRIRQTKQDGTLHVRVEAAQPVTVEFHIDIRTEKL